MPPCVDLSNSPWGGRLRLLTFRLYRLVGLMPGRCGRGVGRGGTPSLRPFVCAAPSSVVEVVGVVVDVDDDPTADEFRVDDDLRRDTPLPFCPLAWPLLYDGPCFSSVLMLARLFLRRLLRKEGITDAAAGRRCQNNLRTHRKGQRWRRTIGGACASWRV